jgi:hypothetical protein
MTVLTRDVRTPIRVLVCYDRDNDDTLAAIRKHGSCGLEVLFVKNRGLGAHGAVMTGFAAIRSAHVLVYPADDDYNAGILDEMFTRAERGSDIVCASRFMKGGSMTGCPWLKNLLVRTAAFTLCHVGRIPTHDATKTARAIIETVGRRNGPAWRRKMS